MEKDCFKVAVFLDGRPGHEKQTLGIVQELRRYCEVETVQIPVVRERLGRQVFNTLLYLFRIGSNVTADLASVDVLIGTGSATHLPMLAYKSKNGTPIVTCMTPAKFLLSDFDLCCIPQHDLPKPGNNIFTTIGPPNCSETVSEHLEDSALILLGGIDYKSHHWSTVEIEKQIMTLVTSEKNKQWTISTSPRTPEDTIAVVEKLSGNLGNVTFYRYETTPQGWVEKEYNRNKYVWVTADSMSMVYEALSAGCVVGIIPVCWKKATSKFVVSERYLLENKIVASLVEGCNGLKKLKSQKPLNEAKRCAEEILRRWKKESLQ